MRGRRGGGRDKERRGIWGEKGNGKKRRGRKMREEGEEWEGEERRMGKGE